MPLGIGQWELLALALVVVLVFGPARLPAIGRRLGRETRSARGEYLELKRSLAFEERAEEQESRPPVDGRDSR